MSGKSPEGSPMEAMAKLAALSMGPFGKAGAAWAESMSDLGAEVLHFIAERVQADVETQHKLMHCTSMEELRHLQAQFVQRAIDDYTAETGRVVEMNGRMLEAMGLPKPE